VSDPSSPRGALPESWALPVVDTFNHDWFTSGELAVQQCESCATLQHPPEEICHVCGGMTFSSTALENEGTVHSFTVVHHSVHTALDGSVPYVVVLVSLDAAPHLRVVGNLVDAAPDDVSIGMPVEAVWLERIADDGTKVLLPQWRRRHPGNE
jgi:uncharacterized OB-fold protein